MYRWSIATASYLNPYVIGINQGFSALVPEHMAYSSSQQRLYLGYSTGAIQYIDTSAPNGAEVPFGNTALGVGGLAAVGNFLLAQDFSGAWATHYVFNAAGNITDQLDWNYYSREFAWDPVYSRVYFFRDDTSPNDLHYEVINQASGQITDAGETPYHGSYSIRAADPGVGRRPVRAARQRRPLQPVRPQLGRGHWGRPSRMRDGWRTTQSSL